MLGDIFFKVIHTKYLNKELSSKNKICGKKLFSYYKENNTKR